MSLLSPDSLSVFLSPDGVLAVSRRGWRGRIGEKRVYPVEAAAGGWNAALAALSVALREFRCGRLRVVLSNHFAQYQLLPWRDDLADDDEAAALVRIGFHETFGNSAEAWDIRLSDDAPGRTRIAAAVPRELLGALAKVAADAKVRLAAVQPYLTVGFNAWRQHFGPGRSAWLVLHEEGRLCFALLEQGRWRWVRNLRAGADWLEDLPDLVESESLLAGAEALPAEVLVFAPGVPDLAVRAGSRLPLRSLRLEAQAGFSPLTDAAFGLALIG